MAGRQIATKRLMSDLQELQKFPVANVSAVPLEDNIFEWHCNIRPYQTVFHLVLFFPENYPYFPPSAEFVPSGFIYFGGSTKEGKKGTAICIDIFSDFLNQHSDWTKTEGVGWSPSYTVQTVLLHLIANLEERDSYRDLQMLESFECPDCGHTHKNIFPPFCEDSKIVDDGESVSGEGTKDGPDMFRHHTLDSPEIEADEEMVSTNSDVPEIIDYISKEHFTTKTPETIHDVYGYGLVRLDSSNQILTSPCEFLSGRSFYGMKESGDFVRSSFRQKLLYFMPMYIHPEHGSGIKDAFEYCIKELAQTMEPTHKTFPLPEIVLKTIPMLMKSLVKEFEKNSKNACDRIINGFFIIHRLFLWAVETYPDLRELLESRLKDFMECVDKRNNIECPDLEEVLFISVASQKYRWQDLADAYLDEMFKREALEYVKLNRHLGLTSTKKAYRLQKTFKYTAVTRERLAFLVCILNAAMPKGMSFDEITKRYDGNMGFPTKEMIMETRSPLTEIGHIRDFPHWYAILKLPVPTEDQLFSCLEQSVLNAILSKDFPFMKIRKGVRWASVLRMYERSEKEFPRTRASAKEEHVEVAHNADGGFLDEVAMEPFQPFQSERVLTRRGRKRKANVSMQANAGRQPAKARRRR